MQYAQAAQLYIQTIIGEKLVVYMCSVYACVQQYSKCISHYCRLLFLFSHSLYDAWHYRMMSESNECHFDTTNVYTNVMPRMKEKVK